MSLLRKCVNRGEKMKHYCQATKIKNDAVIQDGGFLDSFL